MMSEHACQLRVGRLAAAVAGLLFLAGCAETQFVVSSAKRLTGSTETSTERGNARYKIGDPYKVDSVWYYPRVNYGYAETGIASWYGAQFHKNRTANGEIFDMNRITAAHRTLPLPSIVRVVNLGNGRSLKVRVNDRGPFARGRIIDLSRRAAKLLGFERAGTATVRVEVLEQESRQLAAAFGRDDATEPPPPVAAPRVAVTSKSLSAPPGARTLAPPTTNHQVTAVSTAPVRAVREAAIIDGVDGAVTVVPVARPPRIFVQAGAFKEYVNANRLRARLSSLGPAKIFQVRTTERPLFRVRLGPLGTVAEADRLLASVLRTGHNEAQIVVD